MKNYKFKFYFKNGLKVKARVCNVNNLSVVQVLIELKKLIGEDATIITKNDKLIHLKEVIMIEKI